MHIYAKEQVEQRSKLTPGVHLNKVFTVIILFPPVDCIAIEILASVSTS